LEKEKMKQQQKLDQESDKQKAARALDEMKKQAMLNEESKRKQI
jgi:hypothetical protein